MAKLKVIGGNMMPLYDVNENKMDYVLREDEKNFIMIPFDFVERVVMWEDRNRYGDDIDSEDRREEWLGIISEENTRFAPYIYVLMRMGKDNVCYTSISHIVTWWGKKEVRSQRGINMSIVHALEYLRKKEYLYFQDSDLRDSKGNYMWSKMFDIKFNINKYTKDTTKREGTYSVSRSRGFAKIYIDEIHRIRKYVQSNKLTEVKLNSILALLCFCRYYIKRRPINIPPDKFVYDETKNGKTINISKTRSQYVTNGDNQEVCSIYFNSLESKLGFQRKMISDSLTSLSDMEILAFSHRKPLFNHADGSRKNFPHIVCNFERREDGKRIISGEEYTKTELKAAEDGWYLKFKRELKRIYDEMGIVDPIEQEIYLSKTQTQ